MASFQFLTAAVLAILALAFLFHLTMLKFAESRFRQLAFGLVFGATIAVGMANPLVFHEGLIFDTRSLLIGAAVAYGGAFAGIIAYGIGVVCRLLIGGAGMQVGVFGMTMALMLSLIFVRWIGPRIRRRMASDALHGLILTTTIVALFLLPLDLATVMILPVTPPLLVSNVLGMVVLGAVFRREITQQKRRSELEKQASRDPLTNLLNRRGLEAATDKADFDPKIGQAVLYFDVDNFKAINDSHGHDVGDAVLEVIASRINDNLREGAVFARQGGDEFSIYLSDVAEGDVGPIADRICSLISSHPFAVCGKHVTTSISMGAYWSKVNHGLDELIKRADVQLILAKRAGKNRVCVGFDPKSTLVSYAS